MQVIAVRIAVGLLVLAGGGNASLLAATSTADPAALATPMAKAYAQRRVGNIAIDGRLSEEDWTKSPANNGFWQREPAEGKAVTEETEFRVLFDDEAVYVGMQAFDRDPDRITGLLTRRDQQSASDWLVVALDSYADKRTAFAFGINPAGVKRDFLMFDDTNEDSSWDAVWTGSAARTERGWSAEFRIPLSQLRFSADGKAAWGVQVIRYLARNAETSMWSPAPRTQPRFVSLFGALEGMHGLKPGRRLEVLPYVTGGLDVAPVDAADPFRGQVAGLGNAGMDVRYGLSSALTLSLALNPDFGQVEADPSQVNLDANEIFLPEKRPFFLEGTDIVNFPLDAGGSDEYLFYSRRIGAPPHGAAEGDFVDAPKDTTIYAAAKLSGKTADATSLGVLAAVTAQETAEIANADGTRSSQVVEPLTGYLVARAKQDLRGGQTVVGAIATAVARRVEDTMLADQLHDRAFTGGLDLTHRFKKDLWVLHARVIGSYVHGSEAAILADQESPLHAFQRPDASHLGVDPTLTSLMGAGGAYHIERGGGTPFGIATGGWWRTPGLNTNDLGYQYTTGGFVQWLWAGYRGLSPSKYLRSWSFNGNTAVFGDSAPTLAAGDGSVNGRVVFHGGWAAEVGATAYIPKWDLNRLRGGPALADEPVWRTRFYFGTDGSKAYELGIFGSYWRRPATDSVAPSIGGSASFNLRPNLSVSVAPNYSTRTEALQYVGTFEDTEGTPHYVLAQIRQRTLSLTLRANWTFSPTLSFQFYAQPFASSGSYSRYKEPDNPRAERYEDRFHDLTPDLRVIGGESVVDRNDDGIADYTLGNQDFVVREVRSNAVLRWEYLPGSTLHLIWSQGRGFSNDDFDLDLGRDLRHLANAPAQHVVMLKASYWYGL